MVALPVTCPVFIGRRVELEALDDARRALARSSGAFVLVGGEAGIGKSRLTAQFVQRLGHRRTRNFAVAECREDIAEPLRPIRSVLEGLLALGEPDDLEPVARRALLRLAPGSATPVLRSELDPLDRTDLYAGLVAILTRYASKRATIVLLEDVHWADSSTLEFLAYLAPRVAGTRLLVVATHRTEEMENNRPFLNALTRIEREPTVHRLALEPFSAGELRSLIGFALEGRATMDDASIERIVKRSEGNALFAEELLKDALAVGRPSDARLPISIRGTIVRRLGGLAEPDRRIVAGAAVLGLRFDPAFLAAILGTGVDAILPALQRARDAAIVIEDARESGWLRFRHALTRQTIYDDLLGYDRRQLHLHILETLEGHDGTDDADLSRLYALAEHAAAAGDAVRTLRYSERAGNVAWSLGGFAESIECFERALAAATNDVDRARLLESLAFPVNYCGNPREAVRLWERALAIRTERADYVDAARLHQEIICERFSLSDLAGRDEAALEYVSANAGHIRRLTRDSVYGLIGCVRAELGLIDSAVDPLGRVEDAENLLSLTKQNVVRAEIHRAAYHGNARDWRAAYRRLIALAPYHENPSVDAYNIVGVLASAALAGLGLEVFVEVERALERGSALANDWGFERYVTYLCALDAAYRLSRGRLDLARDRFVAASGDRDYLGGSVVARIAPALALALGDDSFVEQTVSHASIARACRDIALQPLRYDARLLAGAYGVWRLVRGFEDGTATLLAAFRDLPYPSPRYDATFASALRHDAPLELATLELFARRLDSQDGDGGATATLANAALARRAGKECTARDGYRTAAESFEARGFPLEAAHARHLAGEREEAHVLYRRCGAAGYATPDAGAPAASTWPLTEREDAVARCVASGLTNAAIAERLSVSSKTVEKHLASIFRKLGVFSRSQLAVRQAARVPARDEGPRRANALS
jgi:DNA-binding CsgD family transcriptional regulator